MSSIPEESVFRQWIFLTVFRVMNWKTKSIAFSNKIGCEVCSRATEGYHCLKKVNDRVALMLSCHDDCEQMLIKTESMKMEMSMKMKSMILDYQEIVPFL